MESSGTTNPAFFQALYPADISLLRIEARRGERTATHPKGELIERRGELLSPAELDALVLDPAHEHLFAPVPVTRKPANEMPSARDMAAEGWTVWCDVDSGLPDATLDELRARGAVLIRSGGVDPNGRPRLHIHLPLDEPAPTHQIEILCRALGDWVDGQTGAKIADRGKMHRASLLRVPGTFNHKHREDCPNGCREDHRAPVVAE